MRIKPLTLVLALLVVTAALPGVASAATTVSVAVEQDEATGEALVLVTDNGTAVENATVNVAVENGSYAAAGNHTTDENGTVELAAPAENVTATVTASEADETATETVTLLAPTASLELTVEQDAGVEIGVSRGGDAVENATVTVASASDYVGTGTFETGEDGTVSLLAPTENVSVTVTATADGDTVSETVALTTEFVGEQKNFGQAVKTFLDALRAAGFNGPPGRIISDFVTANNPGNADDAPGRSDAVDRSDAPGRSDAAERGANASAAADRGADGERGAPEHAKKGKNPDDSDSDPDAPEDDRAANDAGEDDVEEDDADGADEDDSDDDEERSSSNRGNGVGNGNGDDGKNE